MYFTPEEREQILKSSVYKKYANTPWSAVTVAGIEADLDAVTGVELDLLPIIKYLEYIRASKTQENINDLLAGIDADTNSIKTYDENPYKSSNLFPYDSGHVVRALSNWTISRASGNISSGTVDFDDIIAAPGASKKQMLFGFWFHSNNATNPTTTVYNFLFQSGTTNTEICRPYVDQTRAGQLILIMLDNPDANETIDCHVAGGVGTETIKMFIQAGNN